MYRREKDLATKAGRMQCILSFVRFYLQMIKAQEACWKWSWTTQLLIFNIIIDMKLAENSHGMIMKDR